MLKYTPEMTPIDRIGSAFLRRIIRQMKKLGVNQTELARRMNVSRPYITAVLKHDINISFITAAKLARALQMDFFPDLIDRSSTHNRAVGRCVRSRIMKQRVQMSNCALGFESGGSH